MKKRSTKPHMHVRAFALVLCVAVACVCAADPFIADEQQQQQRAAPTPPPVTPSPKPAALRQPVAPARAAPATPAPAPSPPTTTPLTPADAPKPGETAVPRAKSAGEAAVPVPVATGPAKRVVSSPALNITAVPTAAPAPVKRGEAVDTKKSGAGAALFDVKAGGTHVAISPSGDVMVRNPDVDINTIRVVQMIAGIVQAVKRVMESAKPAHHHKEPADVRKAGGKQNDDDDNGDNGDDKERDDNGKGAASASPAVIVKQRVTIVAGGSGGDADGAAPLDRMQPIPQELTDDSVSAASARPYLRRDNLVDDAKPYARKLHYRVRRDYGGGGSVGDVRFDRFSAPITMQLQVSSSTIPQAEFAPDSYRFAVDIAGQPTFFVDLPHQKQN